MKVFSPREDPVLYNGHYLYKGNAYTNRDYIVEDMILSNDKNPIDFYFHDDVFSAIDWTIEPPEHIDELYRQRAQQLRDKYKCLILSYSGGSDSQQILDIFLKHNIHLDEVQTISWEKLVAGKNEQEIFNDDAIKFLLEYNINVVPNLKRIKDVSPNTKITVLDTSDFLFNDITSGNFETIGIKNLGAFRGILVPVPRSWTLTQNYHMNKTTSKDGVCLIQGIEKPHFYEHEGRCYFRFSDAGYYCEKFINNKLIDNSFRTEYFFWTPDLPQIVIKQANLLKNALNRDKTFYDILNETKRVSKKHLGGTNIKSLTFETQEDYMTSVIYPNSRVIYEFGKPSKMGPEYMALAKLHGMGSKVSAGMREALSYRLNRYKNINNRIKTSIIFTKSYYVGDFRPEWTE